MTDETKVNEEQIRKEHMKNVNMAAHWVYLCAVLIGSFLLMVLLIAVLGA